MATRDPSPRKRPTKKTNVRIDSRAPLARLRDRLGLRCPKRGRCSGARLVEGLETSAGGPAQSAGQGVIRPLLSIEAEAYLAHLTRLDPESRRQRFARPVDDRTLARFVAAIDWSRALVLAHIEEGRVRGAAHLAWPDIAWLGGDGELAVAVEQDWRRGGIGGRLLERAAGEARARALAGIVFFSQTDNAPMLALARRFEAPLSLYGDEVEAHIALTAPMPDRPRVFAGMAV
jgi:GNAT superfamily N-acetyltransferase